VSRSKRKLNLLPPEIIRCRRMVLDAVRGLGGPVPGWMFTRAGLEPGASLGDGGSTADRRGIETVDKEEGRAQCKTAKSQ